MRTVIQWILILWSFASSSLAQGPDRTSTPPPLDALEILQGVQSTFPQNPVQVTAEMIAKDKRGKIKARRLLDFYLDLTSPDAVTSYVLSDAFGEELNRIEIQRPSGQPVTIRYFEGSPAVEKELQDFTLPIDQLDFSWSDLTFDYLWWTNASLQGFDKVSGRECYLIDVLPPNPDQTTYARIRLAIDRASKGLMKVEAFDTKDVLLKKVQVRSLRKIQGTFSVGDIEVRTYPARTKTRLRIREMVVDGEEHLLKEGG